MPVRAKRTFEDYYPGFTDVDESFELRESVHNLGAISASGNYFLLAANTDIKIISVKLVVDTTVAVSTTNYWTAQIANMTQLDNLLSTVDNTNYDTALTADTVYEITPDQNNYLREDDVLELQLTKVSSASNLAGLLAVVEYVVTGQVATTTSTSSSTTTTTTTSTSTSSSTTTTTT